VTAAGIEWRWSRPSAGTHVVAFQRLDSHSANVAFSICSTFWHAMAHQTQDCVHVKFAHPNASVVHSRSYNSYSDLGWSSIDFSSYWYFECCSGSKQLFARPRVVDYFVN